MNKMGIIDLRKLERKLLSDIESAEVTLAALKKQHGRVTRAITKQIKANKRSGPIPSIYQSDLSWKQKIVFILDGLKQATIEEISKNISTREPDLNYDKVYVTVQRTVIRMINEALLVKEGLYKSTYKLNLQSQ